MSQTLSANGLRDARLRFTVTAGEATGPVPSADGEALCVVYAVPVQDYPTQEKVLTTPWPRNERSPLAGSKCSSYAENIIALRTAHEGGAGEAVFANTRGELCEGATSNIFIVSQGRTLTPTLKSGCLAGITRELVLEACRTDGVEIAEEDVPLRALRDADEAFLTSSTRGVQSIAKVDGSTLPKSPGAATGRIARIYQKMIDSEEDP